jgi:hypothetical protein
MSAGFEKWFRQEFPLWTDSNDTTLKEWMRKAWNASSKAEQKEHAPDMAELDYWRNRNNSRINWRDKEDGLSHRQRIDVLRDIVRNRR